MVAAAGRGDRSGLDPPKQYLYLAGASLIRRAVDLLQQGGCGQVVVALPREMAPPEDVLAGGSVAFVAGGGTRQESVANALEHIDADRVVVHDAARPLADLALLQRVLGALEDADGAVPGVPVEETIKKVSGDRLETVDRAGLWRAQTPAAFDARLLREAHRQAAADGLDGTDDAQLLERAGGRVVIVPGSSRNIKITYPEDVELVAALLDRQS